MQKTFRYLVPSERDMTIYMTMSFSDYFWDVFFLSTLGGEGCSDLCLCVFFLCRWLWVEGRSIMCSDVFMFEESQNSLMLESLNLKRQG